MRIQFSFNTHLIAALSVVLLSAGCASQEPRRAADQADGGMGLLGSMAPFLTRGVPERGDARTIGERPPQAQGYVDMGSPDEPAASSGGEPQVAAAGAGSYTLNFVNADTQEFVRAVFDEVLKESVVIDPNLSGRITVRTQQPVTRAAALELVREALQVSGASLARSGQVWRVTGLAGAGAAAARAREMIRIVPLRYASAGDARQALQALVGNTGGTEIVATNNGRHLILAGRAADIDAMEQALGQLDIDEMRGQSFALIPLNQANAANVSRELKQMFADNDAPKGLKVFPIERMNAVMVVSRERSAMARVQEWVSRLDQAGHDQRRVYAYPVRNRRAAELATVLNGMLGTSGGGAGGAQTPVAPSLTPQTTKVASLSSPPASGGDGAPAEAPPGQRSEQAAATSVEVRADTSTNTLVVVARPEDYRIIEAAIRSLDVMPTQVLIEVTIAEVRLNDALRHGVRWFFQTGAHSITLTDRTSGNSNAVLEGFNYAFGVASARVALNALERMTDVEIVSSPALTVLDNQTATLKVGDQVPIATRSARSVANPDAPIVNDIQLKDTGIILSVTPRVNSSGLVSLEVTQEASDVVPTTTSTIDSPTIRQRQITSHVAVQSGGEIVLGGIITRRQERGRTGVPLLKDIPLLGEAFSTDRRLEQGRTELLVILRPTVVANQAELRAVTAEIKARMQGASGSLYGIR